MARSISWLGTSRSFVIPCDNTTTAFPAKKNAVVDSLTARLEFIDAVPKVIGFGSPEFVAELSQSDSRGALQLNLLGQRIEPSEERKRSVFVARIRVFRLISGKAS
jgi:hypothetical protein